MPPRRSKPIGFARGFRVPTHDAICKALKSKNNIAKSLNDDAFLKLINHFKPIPKPTNDLDWLAQFCEPGQTCDEFIRWSPHSAKKYLGNKCYVYLVQIGDFDDRMKFNEIIDYSKRFFSSNVIKLYPDVIKLNFEKTPNKRGYGFSITASVGNVKRKLSARYDKESDRYQILAKGLHNILYQIKPKDASCLIGLTGSDLYCEESDLFVAGLADPDKRVAAFSYFRYDPTITFSEELWHDIKKKKKVAKKLSDDFERLLLTRTCKLMVHETCHLLGIDHCIYMDCAMNGSGHIEEDFRQSMWLCPIDLKKLKIIIDFDIVVRYKKLKEFFDRHNSHDESEWLKNVIASLENESNEKKD